MSVKQDYAECDVFGFDVNDKCFKEEQDVDLVDNDKVDKNTDMEEMNTVDEDSEVDPFRNVMPESKHLSTTGTGSEPIEDSAEVVETTIADENISVGPTGSTFHSDNVKEDDQCDLGKQQRSLRRKRLRRIIKKCNGNPSFTRLLRVNLDISDDEQYFDSSYYEQLEEEKDDSMDFITTNINGQVLPKKRGRPSKYLPTIPDTSASVVGSFDNVSSTKPKLGKIRFSVDAALGLKTSKVHTAIIDYRRKYAASYVLPSFLPGTETSGYQNETYQQNSNDTFATTMNSNLTGSFKVYNEKKQKELESLSPLEEGWYEGYTSLALPEDNLYLSSRPIHQWIRSNLEFFSATIDDMSLSQGGRRTPTVHGRVGIRCIHCRAAATASNSVSAIDGAAHASTETPHYNSNSTAYAQLSSSDRSKLWPPGSISYPLNIATIYSACSQKIYNHFMDNCPSMPESARTQMLYLMKDPIISSSSQSTPSGGTQRVTAAAYYTISAKRLGLVDVKNGIRFGRDLSLEPLPFEDIRAQVEIGQQFQHQQSTFVAESSVMPGIDSSRTEISSEGIDRSIENTKETMTPRSLTISNPVPTPETERLKVDEEFEGVLAETVAEADDIDKYVGRSQDKALVSDYMFLIIRQMRFCHAVSFDLTSRGKKPKSIRIGLGGFNCRWCQLAADQVLNSHFTNNNPMGKLNETQPVDAINIAFSDTSCRSFPSAAENLSSSIYNSFSSHLQKCERVPIRMRKALAAYRKIHTRQLSQLMYGSQRKLVLDIWHRLRSVDRTEAQMSNIVPIRVSGSIIEMDDRNKKNLTPAPCRSAGIQSEEVDDDEVTNNRTSNFPVINDPETQKILKEAEESWDPNENDNLIQPCDRHLVTDYVFLTMRQTKIAFCDEHDSHANSFPFPGIACMHCFSEEQSNIESTTRRTFASKADNLAPAINSTLYNHMQECSFIPLHTKIALQRTRKKHSEQVTRIKFGSQRRFFNRLISRLQEAKDRPDVQNRRQSNTTSNKIIQYGFLCISSTLEAETVLICKKCRRVPFQFRAPYSILYGMRSIEMAGIHSTLCQTSDSIYIEIIANAMERVLDVHHNGDIEVMQSESFRALVSAAVNSKDDIINFITGTVKDFIQQRKSNTTIKNDIVSSTNNDEVAILPTTTTNTTNYGSSRGLWKLFGDEVSVMDVEHAFSAFTEQYTHLTPNLVDHKAWVDFLLLLSPFLDIHPTESLICT